jgi:hypothetical protein
VEEGGAEQAPLLPLLAEKLGGDVGGGWAPRGQHTRRLSGHFVAGDASVQ